MTTLRLMIPAEWDASLQSLEWAVLDRKGWLMRRGRSTLADAPRCEETEVVVPAALVTCIPVQLPPGNRAKVLAALPFLVEEHIISPPEDIHAVLTGLQDDAGRDLAAVIDKSWLRGTLERLARAGIQPRRAFHATALPDLPLRGWSIVCAGPESFVKTGAMEGFPLDIDDASTALPFAFELALQTTDPAQRPHQCLLYGEPPARLEDWQAAAGMSIERSHRQEWFLGPAPECNLLQGEFQPAASYSRHLAAFHPALVMLLAIIAAQGVFSLLDYVVRASQSSRLDRDMVALYKATFPNAVNVVDAPLQMQRNLDELRHGSGQAGNADYLPLLAGVSRATGAIPADRLRAMEFRDGRLTLQLVLPDQGQAQALRQRLASAGLAAAMEAQQTVSQGVEFKLVISGGGL